MKAVTYGVETKFKALFIEVNFKMPLLCTPHRGSLPTEPKRIGEKTRPANKDRGAEEESSPQGTLGEPLPGGGGGTTMFFVHCG